MDNGVLRALLAKITWLAERLYEVGGPDDVVDNPARFAAVTQALWPADEIEALLEDPEYSVDFYEGGGPAAHAKLLEVVQVLEAILGDAGETARPHLA